MGGDLRPRVIWLPARPTRTGPGRLQGSGWPMAPPVPVHPTGADFPPQTAELKVVVRSKLSAAMRVPLECCSALSRSRLSCSIVTSQ